MRNIWRRLAKNIVRYEESRDRDQDVAECENSLCETECEEIATIYPREEQTSYHERDTISGNPRCLHDVHTGDMRDREKSYHPERYEEDRHLWLDNHHSEGSDSCCGRRESEEIILSVLFLQCKSDETIEDGAEIERSEWCAPGDEPYPETWMEAKIDKVSNVVEIWACFCTAKFSCCLAIKCIRDESSDDEQLRPYP